MHYNLRPTSDSALSDCLLLVPPSPRPLNATPTYHLSPVPFTNTTDVGTPPTPSQQSINASFTKLNLRQYITHAYSTPHQSFPPSPMASQYLSRPSGIGNC
ncbi:hypothetical protein E2C01_090627 [Portunus trituberculatus]|uniref:Uncharacterized protein n=1 Tax=Portunus trituberculatus TaxID=210409 RepID=A0A5B7JQL7_PORTR|nr:hypothetical protein [Portunus trituberculatus]